MNKKDRFIQAKLQEDKKISNQANEVFKNFKGGIILDNNKPKERKILKISLMQGVLAFSSLVIVGVLGGNLYAHLNGRPNIYSAIKSLFIKEAKYTQSEVEVGEYVENNGIKLTLKTVAMDENVLITKYIAEGDKLTNEFYTYNEFENEMLHYAKRRLSLLGMDVGEEEYKKYKNQLDEGSDEEIEDYNRILARFKALGLTDSEAKELLESATTAYIKYIGKQIMPEVYESDAKIKEMLENVVATFEAKVSSKFTIIQSNDTLQGIGIKAISQKIEKSGNNYIIYNIYNVDTITDLASKFDLIIKITQIGNVKGKWNFETKLEKARLDTRVETIEFFENNIAQHVAAGVVVADNTRYNATVEAKKLVISDFSTVLMLQTKTDNANMYKEYGKNGLPCVFVITDENGTVLGTGTCSNENYEKALSTEGTAIYTDRILLENVDKDTKKIIVKIYEQLFDEEVSKETIKTMIGAPLTLDIDAARYSNHFELNQELYNENQGVKLMYPGSWVYGEKENSVILYSPEDVDGNKASLKIQKIAQEDIDNGKVTLSNVEDLKNPEKTAITIAGYTGESYIYSYDSNNTIKERQIRVKKDNSLYYIEFRAINAQFERYNKTVEEMLNTVEFFEKQPEKKFVAYYSDKSTESKETVRVYEDGTVTISFSQEAIDGWFYTQEANVEYTITGIDEKITGVEFVDISKNGYTGKKIFLYGTSKLYFALSSDLSSQGTLKAKVIPGKFSQYVKEIYVEKISEEEQHDGFITVIMDTTGKLYQVNNDGTIKEYIEPTEESSAMDTKQEIQDANEVKSITEKVLNMAGKSNGNAKDALLVIKPDLNINYNDSIKDYFQNDKNSVFVNTNLKYDAFKKEMLKYTTEEYFETYVMNNKKFKEAIKIVDENIYVYPENYGQSDVYTVERVEKMKRDGDRYQYNVYLRKNAINGQNGTSTTVLVEVIRTDYGLKVDLIMVG